MDLGMLAELAGAVFALYVVYLVLKRVFGKREKKKDEE